MKHLVQGAGRPRTTALLTMAIASLLVSTTALAQEDARGLVAVMPIDVQAAPGLNDSSRLALEEALRGTAGSALTPMGYTVLNRDNTIRLLEDNDVDLDKVCNSTCALDAAREMNAAYYVTGTLAQVEGTFVLTIIVGEKEQGRQMAEAQLSAKTVLELRRQVLDSVSLFQGVERIGAAPGAMFAVSFETTPPGAQVRVDDVVVCAATPCEQSLPTGQRNVVLRRPGYEEATQKVRLIEPTRVAVALTPSTREAQEGQAVSWTPARVTDTAAGLEWERLPSKGSRDWADANDRCRRLQRDGGGWRLPTRGELGALVNGAHRPAIDPEAFPDTEATGYWTASNEAGADLLAVVDFAGGLVVQGAPADQYAARCVRSLRRDTTRFVTGEGTVRDLKNGREWQRLASAARMPADQAATVCEALRLDGDGWRLPARNELLALADPTVRPAIDPDAFPDTPPGDFWTAEADGARVSFRDGSTSTMGADAFVRCVRTPTFAVLAASGSLYAVRAGLGAHTGVLGIGIEYRLFDLVLPGGITRGFKVALGTGTHLASAGFSLGPTAGSGVYFDAHFVWSRAGLFGGMLAPGYGVGATVGYDWRPVRGLSVKAGAGLAHNTANEKARPLMFDLAVGPVF